VPEKVDMVVNPTTPLEFVLAREATDRVLRKERLLLTAFQQVEREIRGELHRFFDQCCPEVVAARSACFPVFSSRNSVPADYEIIVLIESQDMLTTWRRLQLAKHDATLAGHSSLHLAELSAAPPHTASATISFYERGSASSLTSLQVFHKPVGVFERRGPTHTISAGRLAPDDYYHDPTNVYTEAHRVFVDQIKWKGGI
jgi:hypothetical protein